MQDNAPTHAAKKTVDYLMKVRFKDHRPMKWPACSPDFNPIENLWSILKRRCMKVGGSFHLKMNYGKPFWNLLEPFRPKK